MAFWRVLRESGHAEMFWVMMLAGAGCWLVIYALLPKPMWVYVVGHELTHALWTWLFGGRVKKIKATSQGGHVIITKSNFLITLAPYFFPFYAFLVVLIFLAGHLIWDWSRYQIWFHLLLGAAYAFHVTLTIDILRTRQSDIEQEGYLFSAVVIFLGNVGLLLLAVPMLTGQGNVLAALGWCWQETGWVLTRLRRLI